MGVRVHSRVHKSRDAFPADRRRALALLAASPEGLTESLLVYAHGIAIEVLVELINAGLAAVRIERVSRPATEVTHVEITDAGPEATADPGTPF